MSEVADDAEARREADLRRADEEKAARAAAKEAQRAARDAERRVRDDLREQERRQAELERAVRDAEREASRAQRDADKAARAASLAQQRAARQILHARATAERAGLTAAPSAEDPPLPPDLALLWARPTAPRRGPRPGLDLDAIAAAGVALADAEGLAAVSMARVAESLGVTTMALYRYVPGKDDLLALMYDLALGPVPADTGPTSSLRERLGRWCHDQLRVLHAHPWLVEVPTMPRLGPNQLRWLERALATLDGSPLSPGERTQVVGALALHVLSEGRILAEMLRQRRRAGALAAGQDAAGPEVAHPALLDYAGLLRRLTTPESHPAIAAAVAAGGFDDDRLVDDDGPGDDADLGSGLAFMLDGIEALVARAQQAPGAAAQDGGAAATREDA